MSNKKIKIRQQDIFDMIHGLEAHIRTDMHSGKTPVEEARNILAKINNVKGLMNEYKILGNKIETTLKELIKEMK